MQKKKKPQPKTCQVVNSVAITPNMQRITLQSDELKQFPADCEGNYIKLLFNEEGGTDLNGLDFANGQRPVMRTYTIRSFDQDNGVIDVDFVRHITQDQQCGFASRWAMNTTQGDSIKIAGPGNISELNLEADWFFLTADMTALPALIAKSKTLPESAKGHAVIKLLSEEDKQEFETPTGIEVHWIVEESLEEKVRSLEWLDGQAAVWCACEFDSMRALRTYFRNEKEVERDNIYISSYWKAGVSEDGHKSLKQQDAAENGN